MYICIIIFISILIEITILIKLMLDLDDFCVEQKSEVCVCMCVLETGGSSWCNCLKQGLLFASCRPVVWGGCTSLVPQPVGGVPVVVVTDVHRRCCDIREQTFPDPVSSISDLRTDGAPC